jgi:G3E family GTPase
MDRIPVTLLTGFLGAGKTTLLNALLRHPDMKGTAVVINEVGEVGLDNLLLDQPREDQVLVENGCICCTVHGELTEGMKRLLEREERGEIPKIARVVIETTGLASPPPILRSFSDSKFLKLRFTLDGVVTLVDAVNGLHTLQQHREAQQQVASADRLLVSKTDLPEAQPAAALEARLRELNPQAEIIWLTPEMVTPPLLIAGGRHNPRSEEFAVLSWLGDAEAIGKPASAAPLLPAAVRELAHDPAIRHFSLIIDDPIPPQPFFQWLEQLRLSCGPDLLRVKGLVNLQGFRTPTVIHAVQLVLHPPTQLVEWPSEDHRTRIVFITRGWTDATIARWRRPWMGAWAA